MNRRQETELFRISTRKRRQHKDVNVIAVTELMAEPVAGHTVAGAMTVII